MKFVCDLHLHSKYSRAVSWEMVLPKMAEWAKYKGINVLATGDFAHPFWFDKLKNELEEAGNGLYKLKSTDYRLQTTAAVDGRQLTVVYFLPSCEISSIYSQGDKARRIHNLFFFPSLSSVEKFNSELLRRGANLRADGRPIVGISSRNLVEIALSCDEKVLVIPAHVWTPWFSVFGSFSGFDSVEECFSDMAKYIYGIETGLSSDPAMNWQIGDLDNRAILSFSDAHSLEKMGREATVFEAEEISYDSIYDAIRLSGNQVVRKSGNLESDNLTTRKPDNPRPKVAFTIEFHPEEGKYHFSGHRDCNFSQNPEETAKNGNICPVCHKPLTIGVMHRVEQLKIRNSKFEIRNLNGVRWIFPEGNGRPPYVSLVPLAEILAEVFGVQVKTRKVLDTYLSLVNNLGSEFTVLLKSDLADITRYSEPKVAEGIDLVRRGEISVEPGYDGKFGVVKIGFRTAVVPEIEQSQLNLFA